MPPIDTTHSHYPPPPPAPNVSTVLNIVDDDVEMEFEIADSESEEDLAIEFGDLKGNVSTKESKPKVVSKVKMAVWDSKVPYMQELKATDVKDLYRKYLSLKDNNTSNPSFYFDVATYMFQKSLRKEGLRVLSNLAELELEDAEIMRTLGKKLTEFGFYDEAVFV